MSFFARGDFKIQESWDQKPSSRSSNSRNKSREKQKPKNNSLVNAGKNIIAEPSADILDDELSKRILREFEDERPPGSIKTDKKAGPKQQMNYKMPPKQKNSNVNPHSQNDLLTSMAGRLKNVEMTCKNQRQEIKEKCQIIEGLKAENAFLKGFKEDSSKQYDKMKALSTENEELKKKIVQMESYLKKYGLKWVGNKIDGQLQHEKMKKDIKNNKTQYRLPSEIDINTILRRVEELNSGLHSEGMGTEVYQQKGVHRFRQAEPLAMGFFGNGIAIKGYKFYPYKSKQSLQILGDLVDGYFPYVLKGKYPNGVFLKIVDKIAEQYSQEASSESINTFDSNENKQFKPPSKEEFLSQLPKQIVKNGKIINIRSQIQKKFNGQCDQVIKETSEEEENEVFFKEEGINIFKTKENQQLQSKSIGQMDICTLKIRNEQGEVFILHLSKDHSVKIIYSWMQKVNKGNFVLMSNFPKRSYEPSESQNLEDLGFFPNAMLHIHTPK